jgi:CRP/FNR family transcriptional regulator
MPREMAMAILNASTSLPAGLRNAQTYRLRRRQALPATGPDSVFFVRSGLIAAESASLGSARSIVELFYPGDIISPGLVATMSGVTYSAMTTSEIVRVSFTSLLRDSASDPVLSCYAFRQLTKQRARMQLHISMLAGLTSEQRVAGLLLQAAYRLGAPSGGESISFEMPLSRNEVAEYLALNADTLSRIMSRLVRENVLQRSGRTRMTVRDVGALVAHCPLSETVFALHAPQ